MDDLNESNAHNIQPQLPKMIDTKSLARRRRESIKVTLLILTLTHQKYIGLCEAFVGNLAESLRD